MKELPPIPIEDRPVDALEASKARLAALRDRLSTAQRARPTSQPEPEATALRVRETVASLRERLREVSLERTEALKALELTRRELTETRVQLDEEKKRRVGAESLAEERRSIAEQLVAETEAIALERDEALARIAEYKQLQNQQSTLLEELSAALAERDETVKKVHADNAELRASLDAASIELEHAQARLDDRNRELEELRVRVARLESDVARAEHARMALGEIQKLVDALS